jgi:sugar lactone lactonase YvrE
LSKENLIVTKAKVRRLSVSCRRRKFKALWPNFDGVPNNYPEDTWCVGNFEV